jgi:hypothetical protein
MRLAFSSLFFVIGLIGCTSPQQLVVKQSSDRGPTTSPAGNLRVDGIYICRGLKGITSSGGLGFWPFQTPPSQLLFVECLRFDASGNVSRLFTIEPMAGKDAQEYFRKFPTVQGRYEAQNSQIKMVFRGATAEADSHSRVRYLGLIYTDHLAIDIDHGDIFPASTRYNYREYDFVPDAFRAATKMLGVPRMRLSLRD